MVIMLTVRDVVLRLCSGETGWCKVELWDGQRQYPLGADSRSVVIERLSRGLADKLEGPPAGSIEGVAVTWILSLAERHTSVYSADVGGIRQFYFQGADGSLIARICLTDNDRQKWLTRLK